MEWFEIRIALILLDGRNHRARPDEAGDVIDMPVGVIAFDAIAEPENRRHSQHVAEFFFNRRTVHVRVAVRVEEAAFGGEDGAFAIHIDRAALEDEMRLVENRNSQSLRYGWRHGVVLVERRKFKSPGIETEIQRGDLRFLVANHKNRPVIPAPRLVGRNVKEFHSLGWAIFQETTNRFFLLRILHIDPDNLRLRERARHRHEGRNHAVVGAGEAVAIWLWPRNPSRLVGLPFGRHPVSFFTWSLLGHSHEAFPRSSSANKAKKRKSRTIKSSPRFFAPDREMRDELSFPSCHGCFDRRCFSGL